MMGCAIRLQTHTSTSIHQESCHSGKRKSHSCSHLRVVQWAVGPLARRACTQLLLVTGSIILQRGRPEVLLEEGGFCQDLQSQGQEQFPSLFQGTLGRRELETPGIS